MCQSTLFRCCLIVFLLFGLSAHAKTPDGETPAQESVCDGLKGDEATKGLYGLCVAYCEAQDLDVQTTKKSRDKILENYDKLKMKIADAPDMPCLSAETEPDTQPSSGNQLSCPCWSAAEAEAIDGVLSDGSLALGWSAGTSNSLACGVKPEMTYIQETDNATAPTEVSYIQVVNIDSNIAPRHQCIYKKMVPGEPVTYTVLWSEFGTLTAQELAACQADILARQAALDLCQPSP